MQYSFFPFFSKYILSRSSSKPFSFAGVFMKGKVDNITINVLMLFKQIEHSLHDNIFFFSFTMRDWKSKATTMTQKRVENVSEFFVCLFVCYFPYPT